MWDCLSPTPTIFQLYHTDRNAHHPSGQGHHKCSQKGNPTEYPTKGPFTFPLPTLSTAPGHSELLVLPFS